jgi:hypothetical protein
MAAAMIPHTALCWLWLTLSACSAARSAVVLEPNAVWLVLQAADASIADHTARTVQIRDPYDHGMPLWAFADWLVAEMNAVDALNMDGGLSTNLLVRTPDHAFSVTGVDGTINAVLFRP